ncbi:hypothetical protein ACTZWW_14715 [Salinarimonas sp. NSM]|uniref:hypothetical protein n=1 Tax=Salinarimonas sp. NSM TaxID=3458003 RepID=UPI004036053B
MSSDFVDNRGMVNTSGIERDWNARGGSEATRNEFASFMSGYGFSEEDSGTLFDQFDVNGDSALSTGEFLDGLAGTDTNRSGSTSAEEFEAATGVEIPDDEECCDDEPSCEPDPAPCCDGSDDDDDSGSSSRSSDGIFDRDGMVDMTRAGRVFESEAADEATRNEFNDVLSEIGIDVADPEAAFGMFDVNGDGAVSRSEFLDGLLSADANDSGKVSREELEMMLDP